MPSDTGAAMDEPQSQSSRKACLGCTPVRAATESSCCCHHKPPRATGTQAQIPGGTSLQALRSGWVSSRETGKREAHATLMVLVTSVVVVMYTQKLSSWAEFTVQLW
ncbi:hypothetical protein P7K49_014979 [Saguinus oedipus]|uniref:Uncharacterized protein n=1 Tax=Saguinus oedipus TaxID=9490 RepID=A0ABQ9V8R7_SAGOE|nr:hypothetical protein P7K49_014979 [Saguinus oedipus]